MPPKKRKEDDDSTEVDKDQDMNHEGEDQLNKKKTTKKSRPAAASSPTFAKTRKKKKGKSSNKAKSKKDNERDDDDDAMSIDSQSDNGSKEQEPEKTPSRKRKSRAAASNDDTDNDQEDQKPPAAKKIRAQSDKEAAGGTTPANSSARTPRKKRAQTSSPPAPQATSRRSPPRAKLTATTRNDHDHQPSGDALQLPPTSLLRTQSTPLELELHQQVLANSRADQRGDPLPFITSPPDYLLKFAPKDQVQDDDEIHQDTKPLWVVHFVLLGLCWTYIVAVLVYGLWWGPAHHHGPNNSTTAVSKQRQIPCFQTNVRSKDPLHEDCQALLLNNPDDFELEPCPARGLCIGGSLVDCRFGGQARQFNEQWGQEDNELPLAIVVDYFEAAPTTAQYYCQLSSQANATWTALTEKLERWTLAHHCRERSSWWTSKSNSNDSDESCPFVAGDTIADAFPEPIAFADNQIPLFGMQNVVEQATKRLLEGLPLDSQHAMEALKFITAANDVHQMLVIQKLPPPENDDDAEDEDGGDIYVIGLASTSLSSSLSLFSPYYYIPLPWRCWWFGIPRKSSTRCHASEAEAREAQAQGRQRRFLGSRRLRRFIIGFVAGVAHQAGTETKMPWDVRKNDMPKVENKDTAPSKERETVNWSSFWIYYYPIVSILGWISVVWYRWSRYVDPKGLHHKAQLRQLALDLIQEATNGGWLESHLEQAVWNAAQREIKELTRQDYNHHWPLVLVELRADERVISGTVVSGSNGVQQAILEWNQDAAKPAPAATRSSPRRGKSR